MVHLKKGQVVKTLEQKVLREIEGRNVTSSCSAPSPPAEEPTQNSNFVLEVHITDFEKKGDGMNAYIVYKLITKSESVPGITDKTYEVWRRFSDFLGLHDKLFEKYISKGVIVPAAPEKSIAAMTKTKGSWALD
ncbi:hypothetical protein TELCIR_04162 [Teladorsagia circumcincta]|uniref:PX domain-containing protein n=1 Tax=Teladorsagia circumcincta TaxID=45464 RepID=A0A2G9UUC6_TELCI|nr:hypothetical protein TELCIR_04162 [Teladorsagia circumcincta]